MAWKTLFTATALAALPAMTFAAGCNWSRQDTATITCAPGTVYDAASQSCVAEQTS